MQEDLFFEPATRLAELIRGGGLSSAEFVIALLERIQSSELNAYCTLAPDAALEAARHADSIIAGGQIDPRSLPLLGVPVSIKDNIETAGLRTTYGSKVFADNVPTADAVSVARLRAAGAIIIGKTALPEFATKGVVDSPLLGVTRNPWDTSRVVGGSSGGAAAAVAAGLGPLAIGNDQAGSIRIPAALNGVPGLKPTGGRIPFSPNLYPWDQLFHVGMIARTIDDLELGLRVMEGAHPGDPLSLPVMDQASRTRPPELPRIAWSDNIGFARIEPDVLAVVRDALAALAGCAEIDDAAIDLSPALEAYSTLVPFKRAIEIGHHLDEWEPLMDPEVVSYVRLGQSMGVDRVRVGLEARSEAYREVERVFEQYDFIVTPTLSVTAFDIGLTGPSEINGVATTSFRDWFPYTYPFNLTGHPALSVPAGFAADGLPVGIQIIGPRFTDRAVLSLGRTLEQHRPWAGARPAVH
jgi:aspartyl-tRNA(Asn)/glutamyl-tRNA(Gln) amidotransferase subunit A